MTSREKFNAITKSPIAPFLGLVSIIFISVSVLEGRGLDLDSTFNCLMLGCMLSALGVILLLGALFIKTSFFLGSLFFVFGVNTVMWIGAIPLPGELSLGIAVSIVAVNIVSLGVLLRLESQERQQPQKTLA